MENEQNISRAAGGHARAESLTKTERKRIAKKAAMARWYGNIKEATHGSPDRPLNIAGIQIQCYVLEDETRVLSQGGLQSGVGMSTSGGPKGVQRLPAFIAFLGSKGIDCNALSARLNSPIHNSKDCF